MLSALCLQPPTSFSSFLLTEPNLEEDLHGWQKKIRLTPCLSLLGATLSTPLSSKGEGPAFKGRETLLGLGAALGAGRVCVVSLLSAGSNGEQPHHPAPSL